MAQELNKILKLNCSPPVSIFYDTTFDLTNRYVTTANINYAPFHSKSGTGPAYPIAFLLHERKYAKYHEYLFRELR